MKIRFDSSLEGSARAAVNYGRHYEGIEATWFVFYEPYAQESDLNRFRKRTDRVNWVRNIFKKPAVHRLVCSVLREKDDPDSTNINPACKYYITDAEVYPPLPIAEENKLALAGMFDVLSAFETPASEPISDK